MSTQTETFTTNPGTDPAASDPAHALAMPVFVDHAHLAVSDLAMVSAFYQRIIGLTPMEAGDSGHVLGVAGRPLLTLTARADAALAPRKAPGLFHTAFLLPDRDSLAQWLVHLAGEGLGLQGASDHLVSEAFYLSDPEGNGIEIYRDRARAEWPREDTGALKMATLPLNLQALHDSAPKAGWTGMTPGSCIGHIHLQVSDTGQADAFFTGILGLDLMATYPGAHFFASGGYHHHVGANVWNSRGAAKRTGAMTGLADYTLRFSDPALLAATLARLEERGIASTRDGDTVALTDPWGIGVRLAG